MPARFTNKNAKAVQPPQSNFQSSFQQSPNQSNTSTTARPFAPPSISISPTPTIQPTFSLIQKLLDTEDTKKSIPEINEQSNTTSQNSVEVTNKSQTIQTTKKLGDTSGGLSIARDSLGGVVGLIGFVSAAKKLFTEKEHLKRFEAVMEGASSLAKMGASGVGVARSITSLNGVSQDVTDGILGRIGNSLSGVVGLLSFFKTGFTAIYKSILVFQDIYNKKSPAKNVEDSLKNLMKSLMASVNVSSSVLRIISNPALSVAISALGIAGSALSILAEGINIIFSLIKAIKAYLARKSIAENKDKSLIHLNNFFLHQAQVKRKGVLSKNGLTDMEYQSGVMVEDKRGVFGFREVFMRVSPGILAAIDQGKSEVKITNDCNLVINEDLKSAINEYELVSKIDEVGSKRSAKGILEIGTSLLMIGADVINIVSEAIAIAGAAPSAGGSLALKAIGPALKAGIGIGSLAHKGSQFFQGVYRDIKGGGQRKALQEALQGGQTLAEINKIGTDKSAVTKNAEYIRQARSLVEIGARAAQAKDEGNDNLATSLLKRLQLYIDAVGCEPTELTEFLTNQDYEGYIKAVAKSFKER